MERCHILIVDDDRNALDTLAAALSPPHQVITASTGEEALRLFAKHLPDLVLLDHMLPDTSGLAVLQSLVRFQPSLPVILTTDFGSEDLAVAAFRAGARDYLKKPVSLPELRARVKSLLGQLHRVEAARGPQPDVSRNGSSAPGALQHAHLARALGFIETHLHTELRLEQVAREAGMSKFHFSRYFKKMVGITFRQFLTRRRITRALDLLRSARSVSDVYLDVGFKDLSHFSRAFHKLTGQNPSHFRRTAMLPGAAPTPPPAPPGRTKNGSSQ
jgi:YesN/AraC family two-component response regulator